METYLLLLVSSSPNLQPSHDMEDIISRTLSAYVIGQHVGSSWGLGRVTRWTPAVDPETLKRAVDVDDSSAVRKLGLYKVQGEAVAAIIGGVYQNFVRLSSRAVRTCCAQESFIRTGCIDSSSTFPHTTASQSDSGTGGSGYSRSLPWGCQSCVQPVGRSAGPVADRKWSG